MPIATAEPLYCAGCGDEVATLDPQTKNGPCCHELPHPWHRGSDGLYNQTSRSDNYEEEDEEEGPSHPHCENCGSREWYISAEQRVVSEQEDGETIYYDYGDFEFETRCASCGTMPRHYHLECQ